MADPNDEPTESRADPLGSPGRQKHAEVKEKMSAPIPPDEQARLEALRSNGILDTDPEEEFDGITRVAAYLCGTPIALISLVDATRQWFKSKVGLEAAESPRDVFLRSHHSSIGTACRT